MERRAIGKMDERKACLGIAPRAHPALEDHGPVFRRTAGEDVSAGSHNPDHMKERRSILFVCTGNICRSPTAEGVLRHLAKERSLELRIESAGVGDWHIGDPQVERAMRHASSRGFDLCAQLTSKYREQELETFDSVHESGS